MQCGRGPAQVDGLTGKRLKVVALLQDLLFGGTQRQALELLRRMDPGRFDVQLWTMLPGDDFAPLAHAWGIPVRFLNKGRHVGPACLLGLWRLLRSERPDVLMPMTVVPNIWGRIIGRLAKVPAVVGSCRGGGAEFRQHERLLWPLARHIVTNSNALRHSMLERCKVPAERVSVVPNGVDLDCFNQTRDIRQRRTGNTGPRILCLARFCEAKDQPTLVRAFAMIADKHPTATLRMLGDGSTREQVRALTHELLGARATRVSVEPAQLDVPGALGLADVFALSSVREALPNVLLEAMAAWLPVVSTDVGGVKELVEHGVTGLLVPPQDPQAMAMALDRLLGDHALRLAMGLAGRKKVEGYSFQAMTRAFERIIEASLERV